LVRDTRAAGRGQVAGACRDGAPGLRLVNPDGVVVLGDSDLWRGRVLLTEEQRHKIEFLQEQVRVFQELNGHRRLRFTNDQRRRLAAKGKRLGRKVLRELGANGIFFERSRSTSSTTTPSGRSRDWTIG